MKTALVVPTIRKDNIEKFLKIWRRINHNEWNDIIIVEDNPQKTFELDSDCHHVAWEDISIDLGDNAWIISRRDSAIRSYGFLLAYRLGADYIFTLDDDCAPDGFTDFIAEHINNLEETPKWIESIPNQRTRGLPYKNKGVAKNVVMSVGFWSGMPDFDSIQTLSGQNQNIHLPDTRVLPFGQYAPICGMNLAFKKEIAPLCYFPLMGEGYPFQRFDDIWFGIICKKICDHLGYMITCGKPYIHHCKASDPFVNLVKEAPGIKSNETFWEVIDNVQLQHSTPVMCMEEVGQTLQFSEDSYIKKLGKAIRTWASLFQHQPME